MDTERTRRGFLRWVNAGLAGMGLTDANLQAKGTSHLPEGEDYYENSA